MFFFSFSKSVLQGTKCRPGHKQIVQILGVSPKSHCLFSPFLLTFPLTAHACKTYCTCRKKSGLFCSRPQQQGKSIISPMIWNAVSGSYADFYLNLIPKHLFLCLFNCNKIVVSRETKQYWSLNFAGYCIFTMPNIHHHNKHCAHNTCSYNSWRTETNDNKSLIMLS